MKKIVKFGGTSLASAELFKRVAKIIKEDESRQYVVPSAPGKRFDGDIKVTDLLYKAYNSVGTEEFEEDFQAIKDRFYDIIQGLSLDLSLEEEFDIIKENFLAKTSLEYAASRGEYLNGIILAKYLGFEFIDATSVIYIDKDGNNDEEYTYRIMEEYLKDKKYVVIPGFYGRDRDGNIRTFSRGGSDITGSIVARVVHADIYENWTDVSGFLVADPHIVKQSKVIRTITYKELRELSYMGANVIHEHAVFPIRKEGIPINIRNTFSPDDPGTMIVETTCHKPDYVITGIAGKKGFASVTIEKDMMNSQVGFARKVLSVFEDNGLSIEHMPSGIDTLTVIVNTKDFVEKEQKVLAALHRSVDPDHIELDSNLSLIAVVGRGMKSTRGIAGKIFKALGDDGINILMIDQGSSELNIIIGVRNRYFERAINAIYNLFITEESR